MSFAPFHGTFAGLPKETLLDGHLERAAVRSDGALVVFNWLEGGIEAPPHHEHAFDQIALVVAGVMEIDLDGERYELREGEFLYIPGGVPHTGRALGDERVLNIDVFAPAREDYAHLAEAQPRTEADLSG